MRWELPEKPIPMDEVMERYPRLRQSLLAKFDDCALSAYFDMKYSGGWSTVPQAAGILFHRVAAECLREMQRQDSEFIPVGTALAILEEALEQRDIPPGERVRLPLREIPLLRMTVSKFAKDNTFSIRHLVAVEERLTATLSYVDEDGVKRERVLSGQLDALIGDPQSEAHAIVVDWKNTWARPPASEPRDADDSRGISYHGFLQQRFYGWLVMKNYPAINQVTLREFYPRLTEARSITLPRHRMEDVEADLARLAFEFDRCFASGPPERLRFPDVAPWNPSPGMHCAYCPVSHRCPIEAEAREKYAITSVERAKTAVAQLEVAEAVRESRREALRPYVELHGPVPSKRSKGRRVFGLKKAKKGKGHSLRFFTPEGADRPVRRVQEDVGLEDALRKSVADARTAREAEQGGMSAKDEGPSTPEGHGEA